MTPPKDGKLLWHLTALENLESIFANGLLSRKKLDGLKGFVDIANREILDCRSKFGLEHYIPFHFMQLTPFAGGVMKEHTDKKFVYLTIKRTIAKSKNFKIITKHPLNESAKIYDTFQAGIDAINWTLMDGFRDYSIHEVKETCMAECVCHFEQIDISVFHCIYAKNEDDKKFVINLAKKYNVSIYVDVNEKLFV